MILRDIVSPCPTHTESIPNLKLAYSPINELSFAVNLIDFKTLLGQSFHEVRDSGSTNLFSAVGLVEKSDVRQNATSNVVRESVGDSSDFGTFGHIQA